MSAKDINALTICPFHRSELGTGWRRSQNTCRIPDSRETEALVERYQKLYFICALIIQILVLFKKCNFSVDIFAVRVLKLAQVQIRDDRNSYLELSTSKV